MRRPVVLDHSGMVDRPDPGCVGASGGRVASKSVKVQRPSGCRVQSLRKGRDRQLEPILNKFPLPKMVRIATSQGPYRFLPLKSKNAPALKPRRLVLNTAYHLCGARHRICGNTGWVIVGSPDDNARAKRLERKPQSRLGSAHNPTWCALQPDCRRVVHCDQTSALTAYIIWRSEEMR
jgi:hypothetical protein